MRCKFRCIECNKEWDCSTGFEEKNKECPYCHSLRTDSYYYQDLRKDGELRNFNHVKRGLFD